VLFPRLLFAASLSLTPALASAEVSVVTTIKPVHSLVAGVMEGAGSPDLLIKGAASPHDFSMKPSQAALLQNADVVFWIGDHLETSLAKPISTMAEKAERIELFDAPGVEHLKFREGDGFEAHDHGHGEEHDHDHDEKHADGHDHDEDGHEEGHHHSADGLDPHIWLDPENARAMVKDIAKHLSEADPENAGVYKANADALDRKLADLIQSTDEKLAPVKGRPYIVFHDGYHYFEDRFGMPAAGAITLNPEVPAGADRVAEIHDIIKKNQAACVFAEPQFEPKLIRVVLEGTQARSGTLDPLGADLEDGPGLYFDLISNMADAMADCLSGS
jgi:zinc transport system substrate-binding protein